MYSQGDVLTVLIVLMYSQVDVLTVLIVLMYSQVCNGRGICEGALRDDGDVISVQ